MCPPQIIGLIAAGVHAVGTGVSALQAAASSRYRANLADQNARVETEAGRNAADTGRRQAAQLWRKLGQSEGAQTARMAANNVDLSFGSPLAVQRDTAAMGADDAQSLYDQTARNVRGFDVNVANDQARASAERREASGALVKGVFDAGSSILGGVRQYRIDHG